MHTYKGCKCEAFLKSLAIMDPTCVTSDLLYGGSSDADNMCVACRADLIALAFSSSTSTRIRKPWNAPYAKEVCANIGLAGTTHAHT